MRHKAKLTRWLKRSILDTPYLTLCLTKQQFDGVCKRLQLSTPYPEWMSEDADAMCHTIMKQSTSAPVCIVCLDQSQKMQLSSIVALFAHESYHVWHVTQRQYNSGEEGEEIVATAVQQITARLVRDWLRQTERVDVAPRKQAKRKAKCKKKKRGR